jgi:hypothetical protein
MTHDVARISFTSTREITNVTCGLRSTLVVRRDWIRLRSALDRASISCVVRFIIGFVVISEFSLTYPMTRLEECCGWTTKAAASC